MREKLIYSAYSFNDDSEESSLCVAICKGKPEVKGYGYCCGYYSSEVLVDVDVIATIFVTESVLCYDVMTNYIKGKPQHFDTLSINSAYNGVTFTADSEEQAITLVGDSVREAAKDCNLLLWNKRLKEQAHET